MAEIRMVWPVSREAARPALWRRGPLLPHAVSAGPSTRTANAAAAKLIICAERQRQPNLVNPEVLLQ